MEGKKVLEGRYEEGRPEKPLQWKRFQDIEEMIKFIKTSERYWFEEGYGSEKRRTPA